MTYKITLNSNNGQIDYRDDLVSLSAERADDDTRASMTITFSDWERDAYVFMPACVYDSNAFKKQKCSCLCRKLRADPLQRVFFRQGSGRPYVRDWQARALRRYRSFHRFP